MPYSKRKLIQRTKYNFLKAFNALPHSDKDKVLPYLSDEACDIIYECIRNVLENKRISGRETLRTTLKTKKKDLRYLINPKVSRIQKRKRTKKVGGAIISTILAAAIPLLLSALGGT